MGPALESEKVWRSMSISQDTVPMIRRLAALRPRTLAIMHGASLDRGCPEALNAFADGIAEGNRALATQINALADQIPPSFAEDATALSNAEPRVNQALIDAAAALQKAADECTGTP